MPILKITLDTRQLKKAMAQLKIKMVSVSDGVVKIRFRGLTGVWDTFVVSDPTSVTASQVFDQLTAQSTVKVAQRLAAKNLAAALLAL